MLQKIKKNLQAFYYNLLSEDNLHWAIEKCENKIMNKKIEKIRLISQLESDLKDQYREEGMDEAEIKSCVKKEKQRFLKSLEEEKKNEQEC